MATTAKREDILVYCAQMEDVKRRIAFINSILDSKTTTGRDDFDGEIVCLHLRKCLELIAFASLAAHKDSYAAVHTNFRQDWNAKKLLHKLEKVHSEFYPTPVRFAAGTDPGVRHLDRIVNGFLTKDDFIFLYDTCSEVIHIWNPFLEKPRVVNFERPLKEWILRIKLLLDLHWIRLVGTDNIWLVQMAHPNDGKVHVFFAEDVAYEQSAPAPDGSAT